LLPVPLLPLVEAGCDVEDREVDREVVEADREVDCEVIDVDREVDVVARVDDCVVEEVDEVATDRAT